MPRIALLCSGLGRVARGHEVFARGVFELLREDLDITLFKGGGEPLPREVVLPHVPRDSAALSGMHLAVSDKWRAASEEVERMRVEGETFAWAALGPLLEGGYDVIHCLEQEVCHVLWAQRHLFAKTPRFLWSNGGALPAADVPPCDAIQEHTEHNRQRSRRDKAFVIPHGVDLARFHPGVDGSAFRARHGIPADAFVVISVGTICYWHKRMDHVIRELAQVPGAWLVVAGQRGPDSPAIEALGRELLGERVVFTTLDHDALPAAYAAADVFTLGSLFETFGIVYIEAMATGLPVVCTQHPNQRGIVGDGGLFVDMAQPGALAAVLRDTPGARWREIGERGLARARAQFALDALKTRYLDEYTRIAALPVELPRWNLRRRLATQLQSLRRAAARRLVG